MSNSLTEPVLVLQSETSPTKSNPKQRVTLHCLNCGSDQLSCDATARWDVDTQDWELSGVFDSKTCDDCGYEKDYCKEVPI